MKLLNSTAALMTAISLYTTSQANPVLDWNAISSQAILTGGHPGPTVALDFAVVQAAVHDAVQAYEKRFEPYAVNIQDAGGSMAAAVAKTTRDVIVNRLPGKKADVDLAYTNYFINNGIAFDDPGVLVGQQVAAGIIVARANDGSFPVVPPPNIVGANLTGVWRPTPSYLPGPPLSLSPMAFPWLGDVTPFSVLSADQFRAEPPPGLSSEEYTRDYNEVKALGSLGSTVRTPEQTQLCHFWSDNFLAQANRTLRGVAETYLDNPGDTARLLALSWISAADAIITTWETKRFYLLWRPVTAIQEGDYDGNPDTIGDSAWQPFVNTPNYPDQSSGANALVGGMMRMLALFFDTDEVTFTITSNNPNANPNARTYSRFSDAADQVVEVRILQGIHFRFADMAGRNVGRHVAKWTFKRTLRPLE